MAVEFANSTRIVFGAGAAAQICRFATALGDSALLMTGANPQRAEKLLTDLSTAGATVQCFQTNSFSRLTSCPNDCFLHAHGNFNSLQGG